MTGGKNLPGPFFYFLLFPAFLMGENTYSQTVLWTIVWSTLVYTVAFVFISKIISHKESLLIFLIVFILNIHALCDSVLLNPEFAVMFHVLALIGLYYWREKRNDFYLFLTGLIIALGIQVHLLVSLHIITVILFYIMEKPERRKLKNLSYFLFLALSPMLFTSILEYFHISKTSSGYYNEWTLRVFKDIFSEKWFYNLKKSLFLFNSFIFCFILTLLKQQKIENKKWLLSSSTKSLLIITIVPFFITLLGAYRYWYLLFVPVFSIIVISKWFDDLFPESADKKILFLFSYCFFTIICFIAFNYDRILSLNFKWPERELYISFLFIIFFMITVITSLKWQRRSFYRNLLLCVCFLIFAQIGILKIFSRSYSSIKTDFSTKWPAYKELYPLIQEIYLKTSWTPKIAVRKIFIIGIHPERSLLADYAMTVEKLNLSNTFFLPAYKKGRQFPLGQLEASGIFEENKIQGYFIIQHLKKFIGWTQKDWKNYLSQSSLLSHFLSQEIKGNKVAIQAPKLYNSFWLIPYRTTKDSLFFDAFHNIGQPYYWEEPEWLKNCNHTQKFNSPKGLFYCKVFSGHLQKAGVSINFSESSYKTDLGFFLNIHFFGTLLSLPDLDTNLDGGLLWSNVQIYLDCNKRLFRWSLPNIGYLQSDNHAPESQAKTFLAPLKLQIPLRVCKKDEIHKVTLIFEETHSRRHKIKKESIVWDY